MLTAPVVTAGTTGLAGALAAADQLAAAGIRVIAVATATLPQPPAPAELATATGLHPIGDPIRTAAPAIADTLAAAGIRLVLITGDRPGTAAAIAGQLGSWRDSDPVARGGDGITGDGASGAAPQVFARIQPGQKLDIVAALQASGEVVAMTGDGVNDAPALRRADIGVAMGGGTEVARQAADLVLVDDNLATAATAVGEGRRIYDNIRRFLRYGLGGGLAEILVMLLGPSRAPGTTDPRGATGDGRRGGGLPDHRCLQPAAGALQVDRRIGLLLLCNVVIRTNGAETVVEALDPQVMVTVADRTELAPVADGAA